MAEKDGSESQIQNLYTNLLLHNLDVLSSSLSHLFMMGRVWTTIGQDLRLRVLEEEELYIDPVPKATTSETTMPRIPYVTVRGESPPPPPKETAMPTEYERRPLTPDPDPVPQDTVEEKDPPRPEKEVVPIEDLDKVEKLLDVSVNTINMPNLPNIKASCMEELKQIDDALGVQQAKAQEEFQKALAEWESEKAAKAKKKAEAEAKKAKEKEEKEKAA